MNLGPLWVNFVCVVQGMPPPRHRSAGGYPVIPAALVGEQGGGPSCQGKVNVVREVWSLSDLWQVQKRGTVMLAPGCVGLLGLPDRQAAGSRCSHHPPVWSLKVPSHSVVTAPPEGSRGRPSLTRTSGVGPGPGDLSGQPHPPSCCPGSRSPCSWKDSSPTGSGHPVSARRHLNEFQPQQAYFSYKVTV